MSRHVSWAALGLLGTLLAAPTSVRAADPPARKYSIAVDSDLKMTMAKTKQVILLKAVAAFDYALTPLGGGKVESRVDGLELTTTLNGGPENKTRMSRAGFFVTDGSETKNIPHDDAPANLKAILDQFGEPLAVYTLGSEGEETRPPEMKVKAGVLIDSNAYLLARTFHVRFPKNAARWIVPTSLPLGKGQFSKGDLIFQKFSRPDEKGSVRIKVEGTLTVSGKLGQSDIRKGVYKVTGEQTYNTKVGDWDSGKYDITMQIDADDPRTGPISGTGPVTLTFKTRP